MKILLVADLHSQVRWYRWLLRVAPRFNVVVVAGDLINGHHAPVPQFEFLVEWVFASLRRTTSSAATTTSPR